MSINRKLVKGLRFNFFVTLLLFFCRDASAADGKGLKQKKISVCSRIYPAAWVADTDATRTNGLMNFDPLKKNQAMLFVFEDERPRAFWMKNVSFDLDIAFFDAKFRLISITTMKATTPLMQESALPNYPSDGPAKYAVEVSAKSFDIFKKNYIDKKKTCFLKIF